MANTSSKKNPIPTQSPKERIRNFNEVALGYSENTAIDEAMRCLNCKNTPCVTGCPVKIRIPEFIDKVKTGDLVEVPKGYHPFTVAPGYKNYCLWIMAGKNRGIFCTGEEDHKWVNN